MVGWMAVCAKERGQPLGRGVTGTKKKKKKKKIKKAETPTVHRIYPVLNKTQGQQNKTDQQQRGLYKKKPGLMGTGVEWRDRNGRNTGRPQKKDAKTMVQRTLRGHSR